MKKISNSNKKRINTIVRIILIIIIILLLIHNCTLIKKNNEYKKRNPSGNIDISSHIRIHTTAQEYILLCGYVQDLPMRMVELVFMLQVTGGLIELVSVKVVLSTTDYYWDYNYDVWTPGPWYTLGTQPGGTSRSAGAFTGCSRTTEFNRMNCGSHFLFFRLSSLGCNSWSYRIRRRKSINRMG